MTLPAPPWETSPRPRRRVWPWLVGGFLGLVVLMLIAGGSCYAIARRSANTPGVDACAIQPYGDQVDGIVAQLGEGRIDRPTAAAKLARVQRSIASYRQARRFLGGGQKKLVELEAAIQQLSLSVLVNQPIEPPRDAVRATVDTFGPCGR